MTTAQAPQDPPGMPPVFAEINAIRLAYEALSVLDHEARQRAMTWLQARFDAELDEAANGGEIR